MRCAFKAIPFGVLGLAAALLVACGNGNGLIPGDEASRLQTALVAVESACNNGNSDAARARAREFARKVDGLSSATVDRRLIAQLKQGARTVAQLAGPTCTSAQQTTPAQTTPTTTPTTTATTPPTTSTQSTTPTAPATTGTGQTTPPATTPGTPGNGNGPGGNGGKGNGNGGGDGNGNGGSGPGGAGGDGGGTTPSTGDGSTGGAGAGGTGGAP